jgi:hypothetical protein
MKKILSILLIIISIFSCSKGLDKVECESKNTDKGLIVGSIDFGTCIFELKNKTFFIQDSAGYANLQKEIINGKIGGDSCTFPTIVFTDSTTLLGQYGEATGCTINFNRIVESVNDTTVNYTINPEGCGDCEMLGYSYNFILLDKDSITTVLFNGK